MASHDITCSEHASDTRSRPAARPPWLADDLGEHGLNFARISFGDDVDLNVADNMVMAATG